jgi:hypothetical protein
VRGADRFAAAFAGLVVLTCGIKLAATPGESAIGQALAWAYGWMSLVQLW